MNHWLDPKTKAVLEPQPPKKATEVALGEYSLVVIRLAADLNFTDHALNRVGSDYSASQIEHLLTRNLGVIVKKELSFEGALMGQFELICAEVPSVILDSEVSTSGDEKYLHELVHRLSKSAEFEPMNVELTELPDSIQGRRFEEQFFSPHERPIVFPWIGQVPRKKARIMKHWATKFGFPLRTEPESNDNNQDNDDLLLTPQQRQSALDEFHDD